MASAAPQPPCFELSSLVVDGDVADLWWRPLDLGRAEAEVVEDPLDREVIVDVGHDLKRAPALAVLRSILLHLTDRRFEEGWLVVVTC